MLKRIALVSSVVMVSLLMGAWAQPKPTDINNVTDAYRFLNGGDGQAEVKDGTHRWEFIKHGGDLSVRKVDQRDGNLRDGRFQLFSVLADKDQLDKIKSTREFQD